MIKSGGPYSGYGYTIEIPMHMTFVLPEATDHEHGIDDITLAHMAVLSDLQQLSRERQAREEGWTDMSALAQPVMMKIGDCEGPFGMRNEIYYFRQVDVDKMSSKRKTRGEAVDNNNNNNNDK